MPFFKKTCEKNIYLKRIKTIIFIYCFQETKRHQNNPTLHVDFIHQSSSIRLGDKDGEETPSSTLEMDHLQEPELATKTPST